jgi:YcxB-like protein
MQETLADKPIKFSFLIDDDDLRASLMMTKIKHTGGSATSLSNYKYVLAIKATIFWALIASIVYFFTENETIPYPTNLYIYGIILGLWISVLATAFYRMEKGALATVKANRTSYLESINEIDKAGWRQTTTETEHFYSWKSMTTFAEIQSHFIVKTNSGANMVIPKKALQSIDEVRLREYLKLNIATVDTIKR